MYGVLALPRLSGFDGGSVGYERSVNDSRAGFSVFVVAMSGQAPANGFFLLESLLGVEHFSGCSFLFDCQNCFSFWSLMSLSIAFTMRGPSPISSTDSIDRKLSFDVSLCDCNLLSVGTVCRGSAFNT